MKRSTTPPSKRCFCRKNLWYLFGGDGVEEDSGCGGLTWGKKWDSLQRARHHRISLYHGGSQIWSDFWDDSVPTLKRGELFGVPRSLNCWVRLKGSWYFQDLFFWRNDFVTGKALKFHTTKNHCLIQKKVILESTDWVFGAGSGRPPSRICSFSWAPYLSIQAHVFVERWDDMVAYNQYIGSKKPVRIYKVWLV